MVVGDAEAAELRAEHERAPEHVDEEAEFDSQTVTAERRKQREQPRHRFVERERRAAEEDVDCPVRQGESARNSRVVRHCHSRRHGREGCTRA